MTDEQKDLCAGVKLALIKAIINIDEKTIWDVIEKALKEKDKEGGTC